MELRNVTIRRLARELGIDRRKIKDYVKNHKLGRVERIPGSQQSRQIVLTESEADEVRRGLGDRLRLPEIVAIEQAHGPCYTATEAGKELGLCRKTVLGYGHELGVLIQYRNGLEPSYVISGEGLTKIWEARQEAVERMKKMLQEQAVRANQIGSRQSQHSALMREEPDYYGRVQAFLIQPTIVDDPELSSETGPQMRTLQYLPFYPATENNPDLDLSVWHVSDHRQHLSLDSMPNRLFVY